MNEPKGLVGSEDTDITRIEKLQLRNESFLSAREKSQSLKKTEM